MHVSILPVVDDWYLNVPEAYHGVGTFVVRQANQLACIQIRQSSCLGPKYRVSARPGPISSCAGSCSRRIPCCRPVRLVSSSAGLSLPGPVLRNLINALKAYLYMYYPSLYKCRQMLSSASIYQWVSSETSPYMPELVLPMTANAIITTKTTTPTQDIQRFIRRHQRAFCHLSSSRPRRCFSSRSLATISV